MNHTQILGVLITLVIVSACTSEASAHYRPGLGRWIERDPAGYVDTPNLHEYGLSDPTIMLDPDGLACFGLLCGSIGDDGGEIGTPPMRNCPMAMGIAALDHEVQRALQRVKKACNCIPTIRCKRCWVPGMGGGAPPPLLEKCPKITICIERKGRFPNDVREYKSTLIHELTHAAQWCERRSVPILDFCEEVICMEHEAYDLEHRCDDPEAWGFSSKNECLCSWACKSVRMAIVPCMFSSCKCEEKCRTLTSGGQCKGGHYVR